MPQRFVHRGTRYRLSKDDKKNMGDDDDDDKKKKSSGCGGQKRKFSAALTGLKFMRRARESTLSSSKNAGSFEETKDAKKMWNAVKPFVTIGEKRKKRRGGRRNAFLSSRLETFSIIARGDHRRF